MTDLNTDLSGGGQLPPAPKAPEADLGLPGLRTYKRDVADSLHGEAPEVMSASIQGEITKEKVRVEVQKEMNTSKLFVLGIIILIGLGAMALAYVFFIHEAPQAIIVTPVAELPEPLLAAELRTKLNIDKGDTRALYKDIVDRVKGAGLSSNSIEEIIPVKTLADGTTSLVAVQDFVIALGIKVPDKLLRFIDKEFMFGIYAFRETQAFLVLKPDSFGPVFAELLEWESEMPRVLYPLLSGQNLPNAGGATWRDEVIKNIDVRSYRSAAGDYILVYGFLPDKKTLIISAGLDTLNEVILRSQSPKAIQK